jgi:hypothetical protein
METKESSFTIKILVDERNYRLDVMPGCDGKLLPSYFTISEGAVIHKTADGGWEWIEGGFLQQPAELIGAALEPYIS